MSSIRSIRRGRRLGRPLTVRAAYGEGVLFASDVDGTLLCSDDSLSERTRLAVVAAVQQANFVYATGRPHEWVQPVTDATGHTGIAICSNGAHVIDLATGDDLHLAHLSTDNMREAIAAIHRLEPKATFAMRSRDTFAKTPDYESVYATPPGATVGTIDDLIKEPRIKVLFRLPTLTDDLLTALATEIGDAASMTYGITPGIVGSHSIIELMAPGVTKASALAFVAERLGVDQADTVAFGDNRNDVEMLQWAGHGVAMFNGSPLAHAAADEITATNDEDGVAIVMERFLRY
jgi:Cof subfamily protein (haloacid dehalogenase superfamily)